MALNKILQGMVTDFQNKYSLDGDSSKIFEHLANYITVTKFHPEAFGDKGDFAFEIQFAEDRRYIRICGLHIFGELLFLSSSTVDKHALVTLGEQRDRFTAQLLRLCLALVRREGCETDP